MPNIKISQLPGGVTPLSGTEMVPLVQNGTTVRVPASALGTGGGVPGAGVSSLNTLTGALTLAAGANITVTSSGSTITIAGTGGGGGGGLTVGSTTIAGGVSGNFLYDTSGVLGELTPTAATAALNTFTSALKGLVPLSGGGTANFLRADGIWAAPPGGGGGGAPGGATGNLQYNNSGAFGGGTGTTWTDSAGSLAIPGQMSAGAFALNATGVNAQVGTTYTLTAADNGKLITLNNTSAITLTCPSGLGAAFSCSVLQLGTGTVTASAGAGASLLALGSSFSFSGQGAMATLVAPTANAFVIAGQLQTTGGAGVTSLNALTGALSIVAGTNVTVTPSGTNITIASTGGGVPSAPGNSVQFNNGGAFGGSANLTWTSPTLTIGSSGATTGLLVMAGGTSGIATITPQAVAGSATLTLPNTSGTFAASGTAPVAVSATTGAISVAAATATATGLVPTPPNNTTTFLRGDATWATPAAGGGAPGGASLTVQYNNAGAFGGMTGTAWTDSTHSLAITAAAHAGSNITFQTLPDTGTASSFQIADNGSVTINGDNASATHPLRIQNSGSTLFDFTGTGTFGLVGGAAIINFSSGLALLGAVALNVLVVGNGTNSGYIQQIGQVRLTADVSVSNSTLVTVFSINLAAGRKYSFRTVLLCSTGATLGGVKVALGGTATITNLIADGYGIDGTTVIAGTQVNALATNIIANTNTGTTPKLYIDGTFEVNAAGTVLIQFAQNVTNATASIVKRGSFIWLQDMS
jgi:hypothetical protein